MISAFLEAQRPGGPWLLCVHAGKDKFPGRQFTDATSAETWALQQNAIQRNVYYLPNEAAPSVNKKPTRKEIAAVQWLFVDIDQAPQTDWGEDHERIKRLATEGVERLGIPKPTLIVDSGGGWQIGFALRAPIKINGNPAVTEEIERINKALIARLDGDKSCFSIDHVYRLPGTINYASPEKLKKQRGRPAAREAEVWDWTREPDGTLRTYDLADFAHLVAKPNAPVTPPPPLATGKPRAAVGLGDGTDSPSAWTPGTVEPYGSEELRGWAMERSRYAADALPGSGKVGDRLLAVIAQGADPLDAAKYPSRSEAQWFVSCELVRLCVPDPIHYRILTTKGSGVAESVLDKSGWQAYAHKQIQDAHQEAEGEWWRVPDLALGHLNDKHAVIADMGGKCRIISEVWDDALKRFRLSKQSFEDFRNRYSHLPVELGVDEKGKPTLMKAGHFWLANQRRRQFERIVFAPGGASADAYNLWQGFAVAASPGDRHESFLAHVRDNVCRGEAEHYAYLIGWMARAVQEPDSTGEVAVVLRGKRGTGKSFFAKMFGHLFGRHFLQVSNPKHLVGAFNAHLRDTVLLFGDEAFFAGDPQHEGILKTLITEEHLVIEGKGVDAEAGANYTHLILASNAEWVVPAGLEERRFFVLDVGDDHMQDHAYFKAIQTDLDNGGFENLLHFLRTYDLGAFEVRRAPNTQALVEQQAKSLRGLEAYVFDLLQSATWPLGARVHKIDGQAVENTLFIPSQAFIAGAREWLRDKPGVRHVSFNDLQKVLGEKLKADKYRRGGGGANGYLWNLAALRRAWDESMFKIDWSKEPEGYYEPPSPPPY